MRNEKRVFWVEAVPDAEVPFPFGVECSAIWLSIPFFFNSAFFEDGFSSIVLAGSTVLIEPLPFGFTSVVFGAFLESFTSNCSTDSPAVFLLDFLPLVTSFFISGSIFEPFFAVEVAVEGVSVAAAGLDDSGCAFSTIRVSLLCFDDVFEVFETFLRAAFSTFSAVLAAALVSRFLGLDSVSTFLLSGLLTSFGGDSALVLALLPPVTYFLSSFLTDDTGSRFGTTTGVSFSGVYLSVIA